MVGLGGGSEDGPLVVEIDDQRWYVCPYEGPDCLRVSACLGVEWGLAAVELHVDLHHRPWR